MTVPRLKKPRSLLRRPDPDAAARLFCFPYSGCGASMYQRWPRTFSQVDVCLVQPPGRQNRIREPHYETYETLAASLIEDLLPYFDRPFGFFGHCGGALPGVELTRQLQAAGLPLPKRLFISSQVAPNDGPYGRLLTMSPDALRNELATIVTNLGGSPTGALIDLGLDLLVNDLAANNRYEFTSPVRLSCGVTAIGWSTDNEIPMNLMDGWRNTADDCRHVLLDGGHFTFLDAPAALLGELARGLGVDT